jgi:protein-export membrane protein SecD
MSPVRYIPGEETITASGNVRGPGGYAIVALDSRFEILSNDASGATVKNPGYNYSVLYIDERPSQWKPAQTTDGQVLNDKYLINAGVGFTQAGQPQVELTFNDAGKKIFAELTKRLIGSPIAIFVGGELVTAPIVQSVIPDGRAVITGDYTIQGAQSLASDINTGIVPAPIYLTSERTIDAKIGSHALSEILYAGLIGLGAIMVFLAYYYRVSGLLA